MTAMIGNWPVNSVQCVDALELLRGLPDESVNCCVTSPPYFGLRDYGVDGQIGLEETPEAYIAALVAVFREARRVLRSDGTFWLNLGDSYAQDKKSGGKTSGKHAKGLHGSTGIGRYRHKTGLPGKNLIGIPWRVAFALQADGWILREDIIWSKPNAMPESVTDRPTRSHEYLFLLTKCADYWYDADAIAEESAPSSAARAKYNAIETPRKKATKGVEDGVYCGVPSMAKAYGQGRNKRSVWSIATQPFAGAHFAVMPEALVEPCILAGCPKGGIVLDPFFGSGTVGAVASRLGRQYIGSDINPEYVELATARIAGRFEEYQARKVGQPTTAYMFQEPQP